MSARCYICDWSPTNQISLFRPTEMPKSNKIFEDEVGRPICYECISASECNFKGKTIRDVEGDYSLTGELEELGLQYDDAIVGVGEEDPRIDLRPGLSGGL